MENLRRRKKNQEVEVGVVEGLEEEEQKTEPEVVEEKINRYYTYPSDGTRKSIAAGVDTKIDFYKGEVTLSTGKETMTTFLKNDKEEFCRSLMLEADQDVIAWLDDRSMKPIDAHEPFILKNVSFKTVWIRTTVATNINAFASTHPEGVDFVSKQKISGETVFAISSGEIYITKVSGEQVRLVGFYPTSGDWRSVAVDASGELAIAVTVADIVTAKVSGETVKISGETVSLPATQVVKISGEIIAGKVSGETVYVITKSGDYVVISGALTATADISGQSVYVLTHSGDFVVVSGEVQLPSTQAVKISGETVISKVSGEIVSLPTTQVVKISGEAMKVSGETISLPATQVVKVSGEIVIAKISGEIVSLPATQVVKVSGEVVSLPATQVVKVSGEVVKISGEIIDIRTPTVIFSGPRTVLGSISGGVALVSGNVVAVTVKAGSGNSGDIYLGGASGTVMPYSGYGFPLAAGEAVTQEISNPNLFRAFAIVSGDVIWAIGHR